MTDGQLSLIDGPSAPVIDLSEGRKRRDEGTARVLEHSGEWKDAARAAIERLARSGEPFDSSDVRDLAGDPPHPNALGAAFSQATRAGLIEWYGRAQSDRPSRHAASVSRWRGTARAVHPSGRGA